MRKCLITILCIAILVVPSFGLGFDILNPKTDLHNGTIEITRVEGESIRVMSSENDFIAFYSEKAIQDLSIHVGNFIILPNYGSQTIPFSPVFDSLKGYNYSTLSNMTDQEIVAVVSKYRIDYLKEQKKEELRKAQEECDRKNRTKTTTYCF